MRTERGNRSTMTTSPSRRGAGRLPLLLAVAATAALAAVGTALLLVDISEKKVEGRNPWVRLVELTDETDDPAIWGQNFPLQYDGYKRTVDQVRTRFGGSEAVPRAATDADPRTVVSQSKIEEDPRLKRMWSGYAFSIDFREERGHAYMLDDQTLTGRHAKAQPGTCMHCHASVYGPYKKAGNGDLMAGFEVINQLPYTEARKLVEHPVACIDCHDPSTMALRVTRPGFLEGYSAYMASVEGVADYDVNRDASRQEMRSFVCGQCHVEYYFKGDKKRLTYPWTKGLKGTDVLAYYDEVGFKDWTHAASGAPTLKAQHPEFEMWSQGTHAQAGVACADCHMPYERVGAQKISDHHIRSPLLNVSGACQTCHRVDEAELKERVETIQSRTWELRNRAMDALMALIDDIEEGVRSGKSDADLVTARDLQRKAQFLLDFVEAENSTGFHAPQESARLLATSIDYSRQGQLAVMDPTFVPALVPTEPVGPSAEAQQEAGAEATAAPASTGGSH
jgi:nitrite reductase (cytochrome c-552)